METLIPFLIGKPVATFILAAIWSGVCFLCGAYIGHHFTLNRDRRKEFNAVADIIRQKLRNQKTIIETGGMPSYLTAVTVEDFGFLVDVTPKRKKTGLCKAWENYKEASEKSYYIDDDGICYFHRPEILTTAINSFLIYTKRK